MNEHAERSSNQTGLCKRLINAGKRLCEFLTGFLIKQKQAPGEPAFIYRKDFDSNSSNYSIVKT